VTDPARFPKVATSFGATWLVISETDSLGNAAVPNGSTGNSRFGVTVPGSTHAITGNLVNEYAPFVLDGAATFTFEKFPLYPGNFPIKVAADFIHNPRADDDDTGWSAGLNLGKASAKRSWEVAYRYKRLEGNAWYEEIVDSDFGAYYAAPLVGSGLGAGYTAGTGVQGHIVKFTYALSAAVTVGATWFYTHLIDEPSRAAIGKEPESGQHRVQLDAIWKF
jgi:hypothetical protein